MRNILQFLGWYGTGLLFLVLQGFCFYWIVQHGKNQRIIAMNTSKIVGARTHGFSQYFVDLIQAPRQVDSLSELLATRFDNNRGNFYFHSLYRDTASVFLDTSELIPDTIVSKDIAQIFSYMGARVVSNSIAQQDNYITLDRGSLHGVKVGQGVISGNGLVGIVKKVTSHYCLVMSLLHSKTNISVAVKKNRYFGTLNWKGSDPRYMAVTDLPKFADIKHGDTMQTSGYSEIFPGELMVGVIDTIGPAYGGNYYEGQVLLFNDLSRIQNVYIILNAHLQERQQLLNIE
jgi:rod shape-determining protein MreC